MKHAKKNLICLTAASLLLSMPAWAYDGDGTEDQSNSASTSDKSANAASPNSKVINPSARPEVQDGVDLFLYGEYLILQGNESGLAYAVQNVNSPTSTTLSNGRVRNPHFDYDSGFRVGVGYNLPHDGWDISVTWMWLREYAHGSANFSGGDSPLYTTYINPGSAAIGSNPLSASAASAHWKLQLNIADLVLGREFYTSKWLTLRPSGGFRSAWLNQKYDVSYTSVTRGFVPLFGSYATDMKNDFWGLGLVGGLDSQWGLGSGFSFYGNVAASLLYGFFNIHHDETSVTPGGVSVTQQHIYNSYHATRAITDIHIGVRWDHMFFHEAIHFGIFAGWEHHMYFSQNQFMRFSTSTEQALFFQNQGDLALQGFSIGMRLDF